MKLYTDNYTATIQLDRSRADRTSYRVTEFANHDHTLKAALMPRSYTTLAGLLRAAYRLGINVDTASAGIN